STTRLRSDGKTSLPTLSSPWPSPSLPWFLASRRRGEGARQAGDRRRLALPGWLVQAGRSQRATSTGRGGRARSGAGERAEGAGDGRHRRGGAGGLGAEWAGSADRGGRADSPSWRHEWRRITFQPRNNSRTGEHADAEPRPRRLDLEHGASM